MNVKVVDVVGATLVGDTANVPEPSGAKPTRTSGDDVSGVRASPTLLLRSVVVNVADCAALGESAPRPLPVVSP